MRLNTLEYGALSRFSPASGIILIESINGGEISPLLVSFSPASGIILIESKSEDC